MLDEHPKYMVHPPPLILLDNLNRPWIALVLITLGATITLLSIRRIFLQMTSAPLGRLPAIQQVLR